MGILIYHNISDVNCFRLDVYKRQPMGGANPFSAGSPMGGANPFGGGLPPFLGGDNKSSDEGGFNI